MSYQEHAIIGQSLSVCQPSSLSDIAQQRGAQCKAYTAEHQLFRPKAELTKSCYPFCLSLPVFSLLAHLQGCPASVLAEFAFTLQETLNLINQNSFNSFQLRIGEGPHAHLLPSNSFFLPRNIKRPQIGITFNDLVCSVDQRIGRMGEH